MRARTPLVVALALLVAATPVLAVSNGRGDLIASFDARLDPAALPRDRPAPISVRVMGGVRSASGQLDQLPQLLEITVAINRQGRLFDRGLPVCRPRMIQPATPAAALRVCGDALVGRGRVQVRAHVQGQRPFTVPAALLVFNGPRRGGHRLILAHAFAPDPPGSFVLPFEVRQARGQFGTVLSSTVPRRVRPWAYLTYFEMTLHRTYSWRGERRSYVSAACAAPPGFDSAPFPFAHVSYLFADGQRLSMSEAAICKVRGS